MKGYLLDTHALMWAINEPSRLGGRAVEVLRDRGNLVVVSAASAWELHTKNRIGKLPGAGPWLDALEGHVRRLGAEFLPIEWSHARLSGQLEWSRRGGRGDLGRLASSRGSSTLSGTLHRGWGHSVPGRGCLCVGEQKSCPPVRRVSLSMTSP